MDTKRISSNVIIKKEIEFNGQGLFKAYFRGTSNRVHYKDSQLMVQGFLRKADLLFTLKNNDIERGVIAYEKNNI